MPRPFKPRYVSSMPSVTYFKPTGTPMTMLEEVILNIDELEALRLKDIEKLEQNECAERMKIAQSTFQRVLVSAREKVARSIVEGKALRIQGGPYALEGERLCRRCKRRRKGLEKHLVHSEDCPDCKKE